MLSQQSSLSISLDLVGPRQAQLTSTRISSVITDLTMPASLALCVFATCLIGSLSVSPELIQDSPSPHFKIRVGNNDWFKSGAVSVHSEGVWWSSTNKDSHILKNNGHQKLTGRDTFGNFEAEL